MSKHKDGIQTPMQIIDQISVSTGYTAFISPLKRHFNTLSAWESGVCGYHSSYFDMLSVARTPLIQVCLFSTTVKNQCLKILTVTGWGDAESSSFYVIVSKSSGSMGYF